MTTTDADNDLTAADVVWDLAPLLPRPLRDLLLPVLFVSALRGNDFVWRGNAMEVERMRPRRMMALMRPRVQKLVQRGRTRFRSLRIRASQAVSPMQRTFAQPRRRWLRLRRRR